MMPISLPHAPHGQLPKLDVLQPSPVKVAASPFQAVRCGYKGEFNETKP